MNPSIGLKQRSKVWALLHLSISLSLFTVFIASQARALPGQTVEEVVEWIQANPTLQPTPGETLLVQRSDTPARRFTFEALITAPGRAVPSQGGIIRTEQIALFDRINGVSRDRLEQALQVIYGNDLYEDYQQASTVYQYPAPEQIAEAEHQDAPLQESLQGEVRQGDRFAYWLETAQTPEGSAYTGRISVFLVEDIDKLVSELQQR